MVMVRCGRTTQNLLVIGVALYQRPFFVYGVLQEVVTGGTFSYTKQIKVLFLGQYYLVLLLL